MESGLRWLKKVEKRTRKSDRRQSRRELRLRLLALPVSSFSCLDPSQLLALRLWRRAANNAHVSAATVEIQLGAPIASCVGGSSSFSSSTWLRQVREGWIFTALRPASGLVPLIRRACSQSSSVDYRQLPFGGLQVAAPPSYLAPATVLSFLHSEGCDRVVGQSDAPGRRAAPPFLRKVSRVLPLRLPRRISRNGIPAGRSSRRGYWPRFFSVDFFQLGELYSVAGLSAPTGIRANAESEMTKTAVAPPDLLATA